MTTKKIKESKMDNEGCKNIVSAAFKDCLSKTKDKGKIKTRINFVKNSAIFKLYCVITEKNYNKLRDFVLVRNHKFFKQA